MGDADLCITSNEKSLLRFTPFTSFVNSSFWFKFTDLKLNHDMLNEVTRHIWGYYSHNDRTGSLMVDCSSFNKEYDNCISRSYAHGYHINTNTIEKFKNLDKNDLLTKYGLQLLNDMKSGEAVKDPSKLVVFLLLTFSDLKKYNFTYWFAFPAILDSSYYICDSPKSLETFMSPDKVRTLSEFHKKLPENQKAFFCFSIKNSEVVLKTIEEFVANAETIFDDFYIAFLDPTSLEHIPGWPLRNLLSLLKFEVPAIRKKPLKVVSMRGEYSNWHSRSVVFSIQYSEQCNYASNENKIIGWEKNSKGKLSPRMVNLATDMDPAKLSSRAVDLNLKLVKWRLQPDLDLSVIKNASCLLLGAGTLGCSVARGLLAWGVEKITFVDSGSVSYSNPARQSLYTFSDCCKSTSKAPAAASALKLIHPGVLARGEIIRISMPGHSEYDMNDVHRITQLVKSHDVVFLLTDSRESRWLPTLLCSAFKKIAITIALGYESYVILRHGIPSDETETKLGCYFCNDVVAPGNSQTDRTLDQQCTVTRPGVSNIAASIGVELLVSLLQHSEKGIATGSDTSCLGKIPHSIRGFIADFENILLCTPAFNQCIACSPIVIKEYLQDSDGFLQKVFCDIKYLPNLTALSQYELIDDELEFPEMSDEDCS
ncbi:hypothetical protein V9T40_012512 [Parthenolecanium corni]|uniref:Ubiquitin-like modifier-activating enzyme ATG7 n=1 Tax=Parthenolecanium corni TaxID=536013 RepID=A0AAN9XZ67_9HEMI